MSAPVISDHFPEQSVMDDLGAGGTALANMTGPRECEFQSLRALMLIPFAIITVMSVPGNLLVVAAIYREKRLKNPTNVFVTGLAISDLITGIFAIPCAYFWFVSYCNKVVVLYLRGLTRSCCAVSVIHLVLVSIDRYVAVAKPLKYPSLMTRSRANKSSVATWTVIVFYMIVVVILYHLSFVVDSLHYESHIAFKVAWDYFPSSMILVALIVTSVIYGYVLYQARQLRLRMTSMMRGQLPASSIRSSNRSKQLKATKTLAIVVLAFAICWLPICLSIFITSEVDSPDYDPEISMISSLFYYANSVMNPLIFAYRSRDFREGFKSIIRDLLCCMSTKPAILKLGRPSVTSRNSSQARHSVEYPAATNMTPDIV